MVAQAVEAGIPVVAFDVDPGDDSVVTMNQSDEDIAGRVLEVLEEDTGGEGEVIYVYVVRLRPARSPRRGVAAVQAGPSGHHARSPRSAS